MTPRILCWALVLGAAPACEGGGDGLDEAGDGGSRCGPTLATVSRVIDGDTVELSGGARVRYLLIDTPESTNGATDCFGSEAAAFNRSLVEGKQVQLEYDVDCDDQYDRLLAYVTIDGRDVNLLLVERGLACILHIPPNGEDRIDEFEQAEAVAKAGGVGMWGSCQEVTCQ